MARTKAIRVCCHCGITFSCQNRGTATQRACSRRCGTSRGTREERFFAKFIKGEIDDCWLWLGAVGKRSGYGSFDNDTAHRVSWEIHNGPIPDGKHVLHNCDVRYPAGDITNRRCVNPNHLRLGDNAENMADMKAKGRGSIKSRGEGNPGARIDAATVLRIRASGNTPTQIATAEGLNRTLVYKVLARETWRHL